MSALDQEAVKLHKDKSIIRNVIDERVSWYKIVDSSNLL